MFFALMEVEEKAKTPANLQLFTPVASTCGDPLVLPLTRSFEATYFDVQQHSVRDVLVDLTQR
jgi:hypothetical protein